jgi:2'-5' RNA ligase
MTASRQASYLEVTVPFAPVEELRKKIEKRIGQTLEHRGEAHITVITPPEFRLLSKQISIADLDAWASEVSLQKVSFQPICVGRFVQGAKATYYIVVEAEPIRAFRTFVRSRLGPEIVFEPEEYFPHITIGFIGRDLHLSDGARKDASSCWIGFADQ